MGKKQRTKKTQPATEMRGTHSPALVAGAALALIILTVAAYWRVSGNRFVAFDDDLYVYNNRHVQQGINAESLRWAFNMGHAANWHPLTWISHMVDFRLFGQRPMGHHVVNLIFHVLNTVLLLLVLSRMTGSLWKSAFVAGLFAVHPLHVESVAWIAERKDVLSTFFWLLTMGAYVLYSEKPSIKRYVPVIVLFALGLMAKPMLVTLPLVLLLMDFWPLKRDRRWSSLVLEKSPLLILSAASCVITFIAQSRGGAVAKFDVYPAGIRIANALAGCVTYLWKMVWPGNLAVLYPYHGDDLPIRQAVASAILLIVITSLVILLRRKRPYLAFGWFWFVGTLVPVIGLVQVGRQAMADRYSYVPLVGLFIIVAWMIPDLLTKTKRGGDGVMGGWGEKAARKIAAALGIAIIVVLAILTNNQLGYWKTSTTLFEHTLKCTSDNYVIDNCYAVVLARQNKIDEAIRHYEAALRIRPDYLLAHNNYGIVLASQGKMDQAISHFKQVLQLNPNEQRAHFNLGLVYENQGKISDAISEYRKCVSTNPDNPSAYFNLGSLLEQQGRADEAAKLYRRTLEVDPSFKQATAALRRLNGE